MCPLNIQNDSMNGASVYYGHILVETNLFYGLTTNNICHAGEMEKLLSSQDHFRFKHISDQLETFIMFNQGQCEMHLLNYLKLWILTEFMVHYTMT